MKRLKWVMVLIVLIIFPSCQSSKNAEERTNEIHTAIRNVYNFGEIAESENYIYYSVYVDRKSYLYRADLDGENPTGISELGYKDLNVTDDTIYYIDNNENGNIFKMDVTTKSKECLYDLKASCLIAFNDKLFFYGTAEDRMPIPLYSMNLDGTGLKKIYEGYSYNFYPYGEYIYFIWDKCLFKMDFEGGGVTRIVNTIDIMDFVIIDDIIYFLDQFTFNKMDISGANKEMIHEAQLMMAYTLCVYNDALFYGCVDPTPMMADPLKIFSYNIKTEESKKVASMKELSSLILYAGGGQLFYHNGWDIYSMKLDGSKKQIFGQP